jgi:hypothetical protein
MPAESKEGDGMVVKNAKIEPGSKISPNREA